MVGIALEERDLVQQFGDEYRRYHRRVTMLLPLRLRFSVPSRSRAEAGSAGIADSRRGRNH